VNADEWAPERLIECDEIHTFAIEKSHCGVCALLNLAHVFSSMLIVGAENAPDEWLSSFLDTFKIAVIEKQKKLMEIQNT
jgi:hypothetical protein